METTSEYILEKVSPIFNKKGYVGTTLSDITKATNLTKGALYCNFKNKEELALQSFKLNVRKAIWPLQIELEKETNTIKKLSVLTNYYRNYFYLAKKIGGCPVLNVGVDAKYNNPRLWDASKKVVERLISGLATIIEDGIENKEIRSNIDAKVYAQNFFAIIEGGIFMALLQDDVICLNNVLDVIDAIVVNTLKA